MKRIEEMRRYGKRWVEKVRKEGRKSDTRASAASGSVSVLRTSTKINKMQKEYAKVRETENGRVENKLGNKNSKIKYR